MSNFFGWALSLTIIISGVVNFEDSLNRDKELEESRFRESETNTHKYYVSVSNVKYSEKARALQMTTRFFIDDLQEVLNARYENQVELGVEEELTEHTPSIQKYLSAKFDVNLDRTKSEPNLLGAEYEGDQIILYIEFPALKKPAVIDMEFNAFYEVFEEQKNLIHFKINNQRKTMVLERGKPDDTVKF